MEEITEVKEEKSAVELCIKNLEADLGITVLLQRKEVTFRF